MIVRRMGYKVMVGAGADSYAPFMVACIGYVTRAHFERKLVAVYVPGICEMWFKAADLRVLESDAAVGPVPKAGTKVHPRYLP